MRTKTLIPGLKNSQKIRAMLNGVGIYMTVGEIAGKFATSAHCIAVWTVTEKLVSDRRIARELGWLLPTGLATRLDSNSPGYRGTEIDVQIDLLPG
jgi:hypothetical protein